MTAGDLMTITGFSQQHAGEESPERHGQARGLGGKADAEHHEQCRGREYFRVTADRHGFKQPAQDQAADQHDRTQGEYRLERCHAKRLADSGFVADEGQGHDQQRTDRQILNDQDGKGRPAMARCQFATFGKQLQHDRR